MNRRGFLAALAAAVVCEPDRLLWEPGKRLISIPAPPKVVIPAGWYRMDDLCPNDWTIALAKIRKHSELVRANSGYIYFVNPLADRLMKDGGR